MSVLPGYLAGRRDLSRVAVVAISLGALAVLVATGGLHPSDFLTYRYGVQAAGHGIDVYAGNIAGPGLSGQPFTYTPFGAIALWPTTILNWQGAYLLWCAASMLALGAVLARFVPAATPRRPAVVGLVIGLAATTCVVAQNVAQGQINLALMGLCLGDLFRGERTGPLAWLPRGALVGVATAIKLTPGLFIVFFLVSRQWRLARNSLAGAAAATMLGAVVHPALTITFFRSALWSLQDRVDLGHPVDYAGNNSIGGLLESCGRWLHPVVTVLVIVAGGLGLLAARQVYRAGRDADAWLIVGLTASLVSPFTWTHHLVYLLPALTTLALTRPWARRPLAVACGVLVVVVLNVGLPAVAMRVFLVALSIAAVVGLRSRGPISGTNPGTSLKVWRGAVRTLAK
jgi:hypothetical protein